MNHKKFSKLYSNARVSRFVKAANGDRRKAQKAGTGDRYLSQS